MKVEVRQRRGVMIVAPQVELATGAGGEGLCEALRDAVEAGSKGLVIDLAAVGRIDSWGIGELVAA